MSQASYEHFVITGNGRSGTRYASELLTRAGLPCAHQKVFHENSDTPGFKPQWDEFVGDSSAFAAPFVKDLERTLVIHQVRDPRHVLPSLLNNKHVIRQEGMNNGLAFMARHTQHVGGISDPIERAAAQWTEWNLLVEKVKDQENYVFWRVEDWTTARLCWLLEQFGCHAPIKAAQAFTFQPKNTGTRGHNETVKGPLDLGQIKNPEFHEMVKRYGYGG